ncbi:MAG: histone deacetylase family protein [Rhodospirillales bacterium]
MDIIFDERQLLHAPETYFRQGELVPHPEQPQRATLLRDALLKDGHSLVQPRDHGRDPIAAVHSPGYVAFHETAWERWVAEKGDHLPAVPNYHSFRGFSRVPEGLIGQLGYYSSGTSCPIVAGTWEAIYWSAQSVIEGAERLLQGADLLYALCRPPGHHAHADSSNGFCFFNNAAVAAQHLRRRFKRVALVDIDTHAGDGSLDIFYKRGDIFFGSIHTDPTNYTPFFLAYPDETGSGEGAGASLNVTLAPGSDQETVLGRFEEIVAATRAFEPEALVVSLGFDMAEDDPLSLLGVKTSGFEVMAERLIGLGLPTLLVQEGGYLGPSLSNNAVAFLARAEQVRS